MAARRKTTRRKTTTKRKTTARRRPTRRASTTKRRRTTRRRKKNPDWDVMGALVAGLGGAVAGGGAYALDGTTLSPMAKMGALAAGGLVAGVLVGGWSKAAGYGIAGAGIGMAAKAALDQYMAGGQVGALPGYAYASSLPGGYPTPAQLSAAQQLQMSAVTADLGAVEADLGAVHQFMS